MSRTLPSGLAAALSAAQCAPVFLVELRWPAGNLYLWNGYSTLVWNSISWLGLGHLGKISEIKETSDQTANGTVLELSGIASALIADALAGDSQGNVARIYFGVISTNGFAIDPYLVFDGLIDMTTVQISGETATIQISLEKELLDSRSNARRYTHEDQQIDFPGDLGCQYVATIANQQFTWGKATVFPAGAGGGSGNGNELPE